MSMPSDNGGAGNFPSFEGKDLDGNEIKSDELFSGNAVTVVNFWFTTCSPCVGELSELDALNKELSGKGGSLIGINSFTLGGDEAAISEAKAVLKKKDASYRNVYLILTARRESLSKWYTPIPQHMWLTAAVASSENRSSAPLPQITNGEAEIINRPMYCRRYEMRIILK